MKNLYKRINQQFESEQLECRFLEQQLKGIMEFHSIVTMIFFSVQLFIIIYFAIGQQYSAIPIMLILGIMNLAQYLHFKKHPSLRCLIIINIYNILIALLRLYQAYIIMNVQGYEQNHNVDFFYATALATIHISMLINPYLTTNLLIMMFVFAINQYAAYVIQGRIFYEGYSILLIKFFLLWRIKIDNQTDRKLFNLTQENHRYEYIFQILIESPYLIMTFTQEELIFTHIQSNQAAKDINIQDSISMKQVFRDMIIDGSSHKDKQNLEQYLFMVIQQLKLLKNSESSDLLHDQKNVIHNHKVNYVVKIFQIKQNSTFLLTFHNMSLEQQKQNQQRIATDQQIGFCNLVKEQFSFCHRLTQKVDKNQREIQILLQKRKHDLINYMNLFKTNQKLNIIQFGIEKLISRLNKMFTNQIIYIDCSSPILVNDYATINQIFYNLLSLLHISNNKQVFVIKIQEIEDESNNLVQIEIFSKSINFLRLLTISRCQISKLSCLNLSLIQTKGELQYSIMMKQLKLVSPNQNFIPTYDKNLGINEIQQYKQDSVQLKFYLYRNLNSIQQ